MENSSKSEKPPLPASSSPTNAQLQHPLGAGAATMTLSHASPHSDPSRHSSLMSASPHTSAAPNAIASPSSSTSTRVRSVPIPQPLLLKRRASRSSMTSSSDDINDSAATKQNRPSSQLTQPVHTPTQTPPMHLESIPSIQSRKSTSDVDYSSSSRKDIDALTNPPSVSSSCPRSPKQLQPQSHQSQQQQQPSHLNYSPRYASPPVGSGGKYMVKSKRASWIDGSAASISSSSPALPQSSSFVDGSGTPSTPSTPIADGVRLSKSRKSSMADGMNHASSSSSPAGSPKTMIPKRIAAAAAADHSMDQSDMRSSVLAHKSGSISKLRETRNENLNTPSSSASSSYTDRHIKKSSYMDSLNATDADEAASATSTDTQSISSLQWFGLKRQSTSSQHTGLPFHERRTSSISSIVTDSSLMTDEFYSPASSPRLFHSPRGGSPTTTLERGKASCTSRYDPTSSSSSPSNGISANLPGSSNSGAYVSQKTSRRSSMSMLKNISNSELAGIVSGALPNPVVDAPPIPPLNLPSSSVSATRMSPEIKNTSTPPGVSAYQHSLHTLLRRQLSSKRTTNRRSMPSSVDTPPLGSGRLGSSSINEADKDVVEINLDSDNEPRPSSDVTAADSQDGNFIDHHHHLLQAPVYPALLLNATSSGYDLDSENLQIVHHPLVMSGSTSAPELISWERDIDSDYFVQPRERPSFDGEKDISYGEKLYLSRSAKVKRWCSLQAGPKDSDGNNDDGKHLANITGLKKDSQRMPTIQVTNEEIVAHEESGLGTKDAIDKRSTINDVPWVDWLEEYRKLKDSERERRQSICSQKSLSHSPSSTVGHRLFQWWDIVKSAAESYRSKPTESTAVPLRRHSDTYHLPDYVLKDTRLKSSSSSHENLPSESSSSMARPQKPKLRRCLTSPDESNILVNTSVPDELDSLSDNNSSAARSPVVANLSRLPHPSGRKPFSHGPTQIGYQFSNPSDQKPGLFGRLGKIFGIPSEGDDSTATPSPLRVQTTIRSRLQYAKEACDMEMRCIIDGLNEYVERGLQYVEDVDDILEGGVRDVSSTEDDSPSENEDIEYLTAVQDFTQSNRSQSLESTANRPNMLLRKQRNPPTDLHDIEEQEEADEQLRESSILEKDPHQCTEESGTVSNMVTLISEDSYLPTPFILTLQELIGLAQSVMDTPLDLFIDYNGMCAELVSKIQALGSEWDTHTEWPCREWYVRLLLGVAALNRVLDWWETERAFWASSWGQSPALASDTDGGATTDLESKTDDGEYSDQGYGRQRLPTTSSDGRGEVSAAVRSRVLVNDEGTSVFSSDDQEGADTLNDNIDLQEAAERGQNNTIIMELSLGTSAVQYVSPVWLDVIGSADAQSVMGSSISKFLAVEDQRVFNEATEELLADDSQTVEVRFNMVTADDSTTTEMEGKGMLMYNRVTGEPSHTMWVIKPVSSRRWSLIERVQPSISSSSTKHDDQEHAKPILRRNRSFSEPVIDPADASNVEAPGVETKPVNAPEEPDEISREALMSLPPVLCNVCERWVVAAFFEQHSELCIEIHRTEMEVNIVNDSLRDLRFHVTELIESAKKDIARCTEDSSAEVNPPSVNQDEEADQISIYGAEDLPIEQGPTQIEQRKAEVEVYKDLIEILDVALAISMPGRYDDENDEDEKGRPRSLQSPRSKSKMVKILYWRPPPAESPNSAILIRDVEQLIRKKVDAVNRMRDHLEYNERARNDFQKSMQQEVGWSEFVPLAEGNVQQADMTDDCAKGDDALPAKKGLLSKLKSWKFKGVNRLSRRHRRKKGWHSHQSPHSPCSSATSAGLEKHRVQHAHRPSGLPILEAEVIDTPVASPGLKPQVPSKDLPAGKSPLSPLQAFIPPRPTPPSIKDFDIIKPISKGAFGSVFLAKKRSTGDYYAIKFLKKSDMIAKNQVMNVKAERMILMTQTDSPFVTKLYYTFQSKDYLYLVLEYLNGGDCSALIKVLGSLPEDWARNYLAEVTLGLQYLHSKDVIHRDLKPDNLLIDQNGHLKLTDFGLSRIGFLNRRVRDELSTTGPKLSSRKDSVPPPTSPAPSPTGSPELKTTPAISGNSNNNAYKHSYFSVLFEDERQQAPPRQAETHSIAADMADSTPRALSGQIAGPPSYMQSEKTDTSRKAVGTPDYIAPESILGTSQDTMVDWWALGVICYEFLYGIPPFHAETPDKVFENILSRRIDWHEDVVDISPEARDFMEKLMTLDVDKRLGANGAEEVKAHPFFKGINWDTLLTESPAFVPQPDDMEDTMYFDLRGATMPPDQAIPVLHEKLPEDERQQVQLANAIIQEQNPENVTSLHDESPHQHLSQQTHPGGLRLSSVSLNNKETHAVEDEFGTFTYKNLPVLEKANEDAIRKIRHDSIVAGDMSSKSSPLKSALQRRSSTALEGETSESAPPSLVPSASASTKAGGLRQSNEPFSSHNSLQHQHNHAAVKTKNQGGRSRSVSSPGDRLTTAEHRSIFEANAVHKLKTLDCLVADDNPISCKILETILHTLSCRCVIVRNGAQAIRSAMSDVRFDIIFMDIRMPIIDGEAAARMIKSTNNTNRDTPIVAVTAYERTARLAGAFDVILSKPVTKNIIYQALQEFCGTSGEQLDTRKNHNSSSNNHSSSSPIEYEGNS
ncbi:hypothetical protein BX666DRAFT_2021869 [Dichotomocladium elegans]|nr:hypothetical protein BX666DRAFT_2021869 [Dichotomocladium elegans]